MNFKKKIIFTGLSLLLSSTFNSAYSAGGADGDETNQPKDPSHKRPFLSVTESDGCGAGGGASSSSSASSAGKTPGDWAGQPLEGLAKKSRNAPSSAAYFNQAATQSDGCGAGGGASSSSSASSAGKTPGDWAGQPLEGLAKKSRNAPSSAAYFNQAATESDGYGAGGGASSSASGAGKTSGDESHKRPFYSVTESDGCGAGGGASSSASSAGKTPGDWAG